GTCVHGRQDNARTPRAGAAARPRGVIRGDRCLPHPLRRHAPDPRVIYSVILSRRRGALAFHVMRKYPNGHGRLLRTFGPGVHDRYRAAGRVVAAGRGAEVHGCDATSPKDLVDACLSDRGAYRSRSRHIGRTVPPCKIYDMRSFSPRRVARAVIAASIIFVSSCGGGNGAASTAAYSPPTTTDTVVRRDPDSGGVSSVNVLANVTASDKSHVTLSVNPDSTLVGTATVNSDGTISIAGLAGFKGVTRFDYTVTDSRGATAPGHAAVFVGVDPFRAAFVADATGNGGYEVYLTNFAG